MLDQHDDHRIDARVVLGRAASAGSRPASSNDVGCVPAIGAETMARMPPGEAQGPGEHGASRASSWADQREHAERHRRRICQWRKARRFAVEAEEELRLAGFLPASVPSRPLPAGRHSNRSSRASSRFASSAIFSGAARIASARSKPRPRKKSLRPHASAPQARSPPPAIEGRKPGPRTRSIGCHQPSAAGSGASTTCRSSEKWVKTWRTVPIELRS